MPQARFEPTIPTIEWTQTQGLDRAATVTGMARLYDPAHPGVLTVPIEQETGKSGENWCMTLANTQ